MLERVFDLRKEISEFLDLKNLSLLKLNNQQWISKMTFLMDIASHLNDLNKKLQGLNQLINDLYHYKQAFAKKLELWKCQLEKGNYAHSHDYVSSHQMTRPFTYILFKTCMSSSLTGLLTFGAKKTT